MQFFRSFGRHACIEWKSLPEKRAISSVPIGAPKSSISHLSHHACHTFFPRLTKGQFRMEDDPRGSLGNHKARLAYAAPNRGGLVGMFTVQLTRGVKLNLTGSIASGN